MRERCDQGKCGRRGGGGAGRGREACSFAVAVAAAAEYLLQTDPQQDQPAAQNPPSLKHFFLYFLTTECKGSPPDVPGLFLLFSAAPFKITTTEEVLQDI